MKKVFLITCVFFVATTIFAASKNKETKNKKSTNKTVVKIMAHGYESDYEGQSFVRIANEFMKKNPSIKIEYDVIPSDIYYQESYFRICQQDIPDILFLGPEMPWTIEWANNGQLIDNTPYFPSNIDHSLVQDIFGDGEKPYIPLGGTNFTSVVGVNMELLNKIGGKLPQTYEDMKELAELCKANGIQLMSTHGADSWIWGSAIISAILPRVTGDLYWIQNAIDYYIPFTSQEFVDTLSVISTWVDDGVLDKNSINIDEGTGIDNFVNEKCLMYIDGQWTFTKDMLGDFSNNVKLIPIPPVPNEIANAGSLAGSMEAGYGITKKGAQNEKVLQAAIKFLEYFYSYKETVQRINNNVISSPILYDFKLTKDMDPLLLEKSKLNAYPLSDVTDIYLYGVTNDTLCEGIKYLVARKTDAYTLAQNIQRAYENSIYIDSSDYSY